MDGYVLSASDVAKIKTLIAKVELNKPDERVTPPGWDNQAEEMMTPEFFVAWSPGIPGLTLDPDRIYHRDMPGYANAHIYYLDISQSSPCLRQIFDTTRTVYNKHVDPVPHDVWVFVARDKAGSWWVLDIPEPYVTGSGSGTGYGGYPGTGTSTGTGPGEERFPDGPANSPTVVLGPPLPCVDGERPVQTAQTYPVEDSSGNLLNWLFNYVTYFECCVDCVYEEATGTGTTPVNVGTGTGTGIGPTTGGGGVGPGGIYCETYNVGGVLVTYRGALTWSGGVYNLRNIGVNSAFGNWILDNRNDPDVIARNVPVCSWQARWDGRGCEWFNRIHQIMNCSRSIEVCCDDGSDVTGTGTGGGGGDGGYYDPCSRNLSATLYASLSGGEGTATLTWDGSTYWTGSKVLGCGSTLYFRVSVIISSLYLEWSCDQVNWGGTGLGLATCTPFSVPPLVIDASNPVIGCGGACPSTLSVTISE